MSSEESVQEAAAAGECVSGPAAGVATVPADGLPLLADRALSLLKEEGFEFAKRALAESALADRDRGTFALVFATLYRAGALQADVIRAQTAIEVEGLLLMGISEAGLFQVPPPVHQALQVAVSWAVDTGLTRRHLAHATYFARRRTPFGGHGAAGHRVGRGHP
jgi:hypothetical protein